MIKNYFDNFICCLCNSNMIYIPINDIKKFCKCGQSFKRFQKLLLINKGSSQCF